MPLTQQTRARAAIDWIAKKQAEAYWDSWDCWECSGAVPKCRQWAILAVLASAGVFTSAPAMAWFGTGTSKSSTPYEKADSWEGTVVRVVDGDTVHVRPLSGNRKPWKVRIEGIDAPEICQQSGTASRDALEARLLRQRVTVQGKKQDDYGRLIAQIAHKNQDIGQWMVTEGQAWSYRYNAGVNPYASEQRRARAAKLGIFKSGLPEPVVEPRVFRRKNGSCYP